MGIDELAGAPCQECGLVHRRTTSDREHLAMVKAIVEDLRKAMDQRSAQANLLAREARRDLLKLGGE